MDTSTTKDNRYQYLDGWRGLSIIAVLLGHYFAIHSINTGRLGVEMFFVLSGRLMAEILFIKKIDLILFLKRRISRVWPALFIFILLMALIFGLVSGPLHVKAKLALSAATFTYNYAQLFLPRSDVLDHVWSLCVEEHIYILLAGVAFLCRKTRLNPILLLGGLTVLFMLNGILQSLIFNGDYAHVYWRTDTRGASILVSVTIFLILKDRQPKIHPWTPLVTIFTGVLLNFSFFPDPIKYTLGTTLIAIGICTISYLPESWLRALSHKYLIFIGLISFSLYLWQQPFYKLHTYYGDCFNKYVVLALAILLAVLSYQFVETPARKLLNKKWAK